MSKRKKEMKQKKKNKLEKIEKDPKKTKPVNVMKKSPILYIIMILIWTALTVFLWYYFVQSFINVPFYEGTNVTKTLRVFATIILVLNAIFVSYFWLNGVKDFIYVIWYYIFKNKLNKRYYEIIETDVSNANDRVLLVYCTCNDFDPFSLERSIQQKYHNFEVVILDDSSDENYKKQIDEFGSKHNIKVVRRENRVGFKAGNINHYLMSEDCLAGGGFDYFVILDSDEIIPQNFITECLKYFYAKDNVGIVQANHISTRNRNFFMKLFHVGVNSHWPTYQTMKHFYGFSTMLGHGAMIKSDCYYKAGGFPNLVAEDLCLSIEARSLGYYVAFAPNIICEEEYPIDYVAFKKRHSKWTQGNLEFIKKYTGKITKSKMKWYEKMDIVLFTYNLPLTAIFAFFIFLNLIISPLLHINLGQVYAVWMVVPTIIFFFSPMLNDFITWAFRLNPLRNLMYFICVIILYGSMLTTSLVSALLGMFGKKAKFIVTPKSSQKISVWFALKFQWKEFLLSTILLLLSIFITRSIFPVILIICTGYLSVFLLFFSNKRYNQEQVAKIDKKTSMISLRINKVFQYNQNFTFNNIQSNNIENEDGKSEELNKDIILENSVEVEKPKEDLLVNIETQQKNREDEIENKQENQ